MLLGHFSFVPRPSCCATVSWRQEQDKNCEKRRKQRGERRTAKKENKSCHVCVILFGLPLCAGFIPCSSCLSPLLLACSFRFRCCLALKLLAYEPQNTLLRYPINQYYLCKTSTPKGFRWPAFPIFPMLSRGVLELVPLSPPRLVPVHQSQPQHQHQHLTPKIVEIYVRCYTWYVRYGTPSNPARFSRCALWFLSLESRDKHKSQRLCNKKVDEFKHFLQHYIM